MSDAELTRSIAAGIWQCQYIPDFRSQKSDEIRKTLLKKDGGFPCQPPTKTGYVQWRAGHPWYHGLETRQPQVLQALRPASGMLNARPRGIGSDSAAFFGDRKW